MPVASHAEPGSYCRVVKATRVPETSLCRAESATPAGGAGPVAEPAVDLLPESLSQEREQLTEECLPRVGVQVGPVCLWPSGG